jgi:arabinoxylan arabinofuranohydrolase
MAHLLQLRHEELDRAPVPVPYTIFKWAARDAWASDITKRNGKYYFYTTVEHATIPGKAIGVAVSDSPTGPFTDARGSAWSPTT